MQSDLSADWKWTEQFSLMFRDTVEALVSADPVGLVTMGASSDEYDVEAAQIVRIVLAEAQSRDDVLKITGDVFAHYFGGKRYDERLGGFADAVWRLYSELKDDA